MFFGPPRASSHYVRQSLISNKIQSVLESIRHRRWNEFYGVRRRWTGRHPALQFPPTDPIEGTRGEPNSPSAGRAIRGIKYVIFTAAIAWGTIEGPNRARRVSEWLAATLEMWCPARGCEFESRALRLRKSQPRLTLRGFLFASNSARVGRFQRLCSQNVANLALLRFGDGERRQWTRIDG